MFGKDLLGFLSWACLFDSPETVCFLYFSTRGWGRQKFNLFLNVFLLRNGEKRSLVKWDKWAGKRD